MSRSLIPWIILTLILLMDLYGFSAVKTAFSESSPKVKWVAYSIYWGMTLFVISYFILSITYNFRENSTNLTRYMLGIIMGIFVAKILLTVLLGVEDLSRLFKWIYNKVANPSASLNTSRRQFLDSVFLGVAALPLFAFVYGMLKTAYDYQILRIKVPIKDLPEGLEGMIICQLSDIHSGSFTETEPIKKAIETINSLKADLFVFTGDLVNNKASEFTDFIDIFKNIKAPLGQFSILGNHDYGEYMRWDSEQEKANNLNTLKEYHKNTNWELLLNENRILEYNGEKIALIGNENWSAKGFSTYGDMNRAYKGTENISTKILLSHDPSHWDAEVLKKYKDIQLTLSGHTHGMQFGVENKWFKFSPVQWVYKQWAGLYSKDNQHLYVNRGFGFLGYPGRVGIKPEISLLTLTKG